jgi:hypothetical protein
MNFVSSARLNQSLASMTAHTAGGVERPVSSKCGYDDDAKRLAAGTFLDVGKLCMAPVCSANDPERHAHKWLFAAPLRTVPRHCERQVLTHFHRLRHALVAVRQVSI